MKIPKIIHQLWKDQAVPEKYRALVVSWRRHHPDWDYRLWTDTDLRAFVASEYPAFLARYDAYPRPICRADAARYLVLRKFGGLYVDLDMECFRPLDDLLVDADFIVGLEPEEHQSEAVVAESGLSKLLCPSVIASVPCHVFWNHVEKHLNAADINGDPLDVTGPFLLTRAYESFSEPSRVKLLPPRVFYPISKFSCWNGDAFSVDFWEAATRDAHAVHYWDGSWFRGNAPLPTPPKKINVMKSEGSEPESPPAFNKIQGKPLISCLLVTKNRYEMALMAIECFFRQTYENRELVIVDDGDDTRLSGYVEALEDSRIFIIRPDGRNFRLGDLRNMAIDAARGDYICQWDDDDLYDPLRLEYQMGALMGANARALMLHRVMVWIPSEQRMLISHSRPWEGTLLCEKSIMPRYPDQRMGEDTPVTEEITRRYPVALLDMPRLYLYGFHGRNTWTRDHFNRFWALSESRYTSSRYEAVRDELSKRLPVRRYEDLLARQDLALAGGVSEATARPVGFNLFGHLEKGIGIGTGGRSTLAAISALRLPYSSFDLDRLQRSELPAGSFDPEEAAPHAINIFHTNPEMLGPLLERGGQAGFDERVFSGRYNIGYWAWESATSLPKNWLRWLDRFDEIWVPSNFVVECLAPKIPVPVLNIPHVVQPRLAPVTRAEMKLPEDKFIFLSMFDELSGFERKNPLGSIEAYIRAFPDPNGKTMLLIKARTVSPDNHKKLMAAMQRRPDMVLRTGDLKQEVVPAFFMNCDAFLSLHRAEGFGLAIAEAMERGKPVIVTGYSGNLDFTKPDNSYLVNYRMQRTTEQIGGYPAGTTWAEPDLDHAASILHAVASDPAKARAVGSRGSDFIHTMHSASAIAERVDERIRTLLEHGRINRQRESFSSLSVQTGTGKTEDSKGKVLVLTPVKNAAKFLPRYFELLAGMDYDPDLISLGMLEGDSDDETFADLNAQLPSLRERYRRVEMIKQDYGVQIEGPRFVPAVQRKRREVLGKARNRLLHEALRDEQWVLWLDVDLIDYPTDLLKRLLAAEKDIVVPRCIRPDGSEFDLNTFRLASNDKAEDPAFMIDGIYQTPRGAGRIYLGNLQFESLTPIDSVGGTALLINADLHRNGILFPETSYRGYLETEGLAMMAHDMGHTCWAMPQLHIVHTFR